MKKFFGVIAIIGIVMGILFGMKDILFHTKGKEEEAGTIQEDNDVHELNIPIMEIDTLNPLFTKNRHVSELLFLIYEPLVTIAKEEVLSPVLATEWAQKDDTHWLVKLRKDVTWHNGDPFTVKDVIFTVELLQNVEITSVYQKNVANIEKIEKVDDDSFVVHLKQKDDFLMYCFTFPIIPAYYFENDEWKNEAKNNMPVGTGPYQYVTTNQEEESIELQKNPSWWNHTIDSKLTTIYWIKFPTYGEAIKAYKSAKVDLITTSMSDWEKKFGTIGNNSYTYESATFDVLVPNLKKLTLTDNSVRKAILTAINRENMVAKVWNGNATIADIPIHNRSQNYSLTLQTEYDVDKAKQFLMNAGWKVNGNHWRKQVDGTWYPLKYTLLVNEDNSEQLKIAEIIKENLSDINIEVILKKVKWTQMQKAITEGDFEFALLSLDIKNELTILEMLSQGHPNNLARYSNEKMEEIIQSIREDETTIRFQELEKWYKEEIPYIGLYFKNDTLLTNKSVKGSIEPYWANPYQNIMNWCK